MHQTLLTTLSRVIEIEIEIVSFIIIVIQEAIEETAIHVKINNIYINDNYD